MKLYVEIESAKDGARPVLTEAINHAHLIGARLVIHKLDRLSRDLGFITTLQKNAVDFVVVDLPQADRFTIQLFGALGEKERLMISERTKAALQEAKKRGVVLGNAKGYTFGREALEAGAKAGAKARVEKADNFAGMVAPMLQRLQSEGLSLNGIAKKLTADGVLTPRGKAWTPTAVKNALART